MTDPTPQTSPPAPSTNGSTRQAAPILKYFAFSHLPERLAKISKPFAEMALMFDATLPPGPELSAGLRKLLEAKDCIVRAALG